MSNDLNRSILVGRLVREPELKSTTKGSYLCRFTLASNRTIFVKDGDNKDEVGFFDCIAWGSLAEIISKYAQKGRRVGVDGSLRFSAWDNAEGKRQSKVEIFVENFQFLDAKQSDGQSSKHESVADSVSGEKMPDGFNEPFDESIPF